MTSNEEFAQYLRSLPRETAPEDVERIEAERDDQRGLYVPHGGSVHHFSQESRY